MAFPASVEEPAEGIGAGERLSLTLTHSPREREFRMALSPLSNRSPASPGKMHALLG